jgi:hypothetical protein
MQASRFVAALISVGLVGGGALAVARGTDNSAANARAAVCNNKQLTMVEQDSCTTQMKAAKSEVAKQQIATRFQSKVDTRDAVATGSATSSNSGGVSGQPNSDSGVNDAASASLSQPNATPK